MKLRMLPLLLLLGGFVGLTKADYVIIVADLGLVKKNDQNQTQPAAGGPGMGMMGGPGMGMMGGPGMGMRGGMGAAGGGPGAGAGGGAGRGAGGQPPQPGGRAGGGRAGGGGAQPQQPGVGQGGGQPGRGQPGAGAAGGGPGAGMMGGPGAGMMGGPGRGMMGGPGAGMMGGPGMGMMGGPGMGMMGGPGMGMMGGPGMGMMGGIAGVTQEDTTPFNVMTVVETTDSLTKAQLDALDRGSPVKIKHKWGITVLQPEPGLTITVIRDNKEKPIHSVMRQFNERLKEAHKDGATTVDLLLDFTTNPQAGPARFALEHNLLKEFHDVMEEVSKLDPVHPKAIAFQKVEKAMAQPVTKADASGQWKQRLNIRDSRTSEHYVLLYSPSVKEADVLSRLKALEDSYKSFFYWFAFNCDKDGNLAYVPKGVKDAPLVPDTRMVSLLVGTEEDFNTKHRIFDNSTLVADGFTTRRDNLTILSKERLDKQYKALTAYAGPQMQVFGKESLLKYDVSQKARASTTTISYKDYYVASTFALMLRSMEADSEISSVTHESPRQLLQAVGLTRRNVITPEWLQFGMGSFFQIGKGAPWGGAGGANFLYLLEYKERSQHRMSGRMEKPLEALKAVVSDTYFRSTKNGEDEAALLKARTMAWSLTYFLAHRKLGNDDYGLIRYYRELSRMPRDLEFDGESLLHLFARSFNCLDAKGDKPDDAKLAQLADEWNRFIDLTPLEVEEAVKDIRNKRNEITTSDTKPKAKAKADEKPVEGDN